MAISAEQVKKLRDQTGAGMMDCKAALTEANGNAEEAVTILRKRGSGERGQEGRAHGERRAHRPLRVRGSRDAARWSK